MRNNGLIAFPEKPRCLNCKKTINRLVYPRSKYCCGVCRSQYNKKECGVIVFDEGKEVEEVF